MKFRRKGVIALTAALCVALFASAAMAAINSDDTLRQAIDAASAGATITLNDDIELKDAEGAILIEKDITLDLNGYELSRTSNQPNQTFVIKVWKGATLTINDTRGEGVIKSVNTANIGANKAKGFSRGILVGDITEGDKGSGLGGHVVMNGGTIITAPDANTANGVWDGYGVVLYGNNLKSDAGTKEPIDVSFTMKDGASIQTCWVGVAALGRTAKVNIEGGTITATGFAVAGNGNPWQGGTEINISGGVLKSKEDVAIYHPQNGNITISGGEIKGYAGIQFKAGTLTMTGGKIESTGDMPDNITANNNGSTTVGAAISLITGQAYQGDINVSISGNSELKATGMNGVALFEDIQDPASYGTVSAVNSLTISGGKFEGAGHALLLNDVETANVDITAGTFNTDITQLRDGAFTENLNISKDADGNYYVVVNAENIAFNTETLELAMNETAILEVVFTPDNTTEKALTWSSSNEEVAKVDPTTGEITPVAPGTTTITAALADNDSVYASCTVTVTNDVKPQPSGSGGGGCSAGFGALALLAALPLLRMRKK